MKFNRASGILLHPTSLPGPYGMGDLGPLAEAWIRFLSQTGCSLWQILPLGPTGYGDSPYQCFSAFAGNPYLISMEGLLGESLLMHDDFFDFEPFPEERVDFGAVIPWKLTMLNRAYDRFVGNANPELAGEFAAFQAEQAAWLPDFALFMALKEAHGGAPWATWAAPLRDRHPAALEEARQTHQTAIQRQIFRQFIFFRQWNSLRALAKEHGIQIIGDIPIFVAHDSADVWVNRHLFYMEPDGRPSVVAGVPPDYFSPTGQLWGNPLYRWEVHIATGFDWWLKRIRAVLGMVDYIRLDHFRGFSAYWEVPGDAKTAEKGRWVPAPGQQFLEAVRQALGDLPLIAEDLGVITPDVDALRDGFDLPGMKIFQFAFAGSPKDPFLPHNYPQNCVVYTGTHDNDTAAGWYARVPEEERAFYRRYMNRDGSQVAADLVRGVWSSVAVFALAPMQDFFGLGNEARMNYPGNPNGNWSWRMPAIPGAEMSDWIYELNYLYLRLNPRLAELRAKAAAEAAAAEAAKTEAAGETAADR